MSGGELLVLVGKLEVRTGVILLIDVRVEGGILNGKGKV